jgi:dTDP-4-amino-4,6-dideoxygalactose transaminase
LHAVYQDGSWGRYHGDQLDAFVAELCSAHDIAFAYSCCSGTLAVELALRGLRVGSGNEVILAAYDYPGNFRSIEAVGATPVLIDIDRQSWCLDADQIELAVTPATRAVIVSHLHGGLANMTAIRQVASSHGLAVIEDACQAAGAKVQGRVAGTWGDAGILSFGGSKLLTAGRGGAVLTSREDVHQRIKIFAERGNHAFPLSELQAAVLRPQLAQLPIRNQIRRRNVRQLTEALRDVPQLIPATVPSTDDEPSYYKLGWRYSARGNVSRETILAALQAEGVPIDAGFPGFLRRGTGRCRQVGTLAGARSAASDTLLLHHPILLMPAETLDQLAHAVHKVMRFFGEPQQATA